MDAPVSGSTSITSSIETCIFMKPASTSMRPLPSTRRTRAGSRTSLQAHAHALFDAQGLNAVLARIVLGGEHGGLKILAQLALGFGDAALRVLIGLAAVAALRDFADGLLRLLFEARQGGIGAALQFLQLGGLALLPFARDFLFAPVQFRQLFAQALLQRLRSFRCGDAVRRGSA